VQSEQKRKRYLDKRFFSIYMGEFERKVMIPCMEKGIFTKKTMVSTKRPRLLDTSFGEFIGETFDYDKILVFNYYGLSKFSSYIQQAVEHRLDGGFEVKGVKSVVVYFASIKIKHITSLSPELATHFPAFKDFLVSMRNFRTPQEPVSKRS